MSLNLRQPLFVTLGDVADTLLSIHSVSALHSFHDLIECFGIDVTRIRCLKFSVSQQLI